MTPSSNRVAGRHRNHIKHVGESPGTASSDTTLDLLATLDELRAVAKQAQRDLAAGVIPRGSSVLRRIETTAGDAVHRARRAGVAA